MTPIPREPADIADNRQGRLSPAQIAAFEAGLRRDRVIAPLRFMAWITLPVVGAAARAASLPRAIETFAIVEATLLLLYAWYVAWACNKAIETLREARVDSVTGRLRYARRSRYGRKYYVHVDGRVLGAPVELIKAHRKELEERPHRVYFLDRTEAVISFEAA